MDSENKPPAPIEASYEWTGNQPRLKEIGDRIRFLKESARGHQRFVAFEIGVAIACIASIFTVEPNELKSIFILFGAVGVGSSVYSAIEVVRNHIEASALTTTLANHYLKQT